MAASSIGMHWTPLFPSHTTWYIQVSGCIEPISTPPSPENMHPSSTQCQHCRKPTPTSLRHRYDWWKYFPIWALLLLSLTIKLNVSTITVFMRQVLTPTTTTIPLNAYQQIGHCPHFVCMYTVSISWHSVHIDEWSALAFQSIHWGGRKEINFASCTSLLLLLTKVAELYITSHFLTFKFLMCSFTFDKKSLESLCDMSSKLPALPSR